jgi:hypothetical protein
MYCSQEKHFQNLYYQTTCNFRENMKECYTCCKPYFSILKEANISAIGFQYFDYIVIVSFIGQVGGEKRSTRRKSDYQPTIKMA